MQAPFRNRLILLKFLAAAQNLLFVQMYCQEHLEQMFDTPTMTNGEQ